MLEFILRLLAKIQYILPHYFLASLIYKLASCEISLIKNIFIFLFTTFYNIDLEKCEVQNPYDFASFNDFFTRALKQDYIDQATSNPSSIISPVDGTVLDIGPIASDGQLFQAKDKTYNLTSLLADQTEDQSLTKIFANGSYCTTYLSPIDYHRVHMPCCGNLEQMIYVPGNLYAVNPPTLDSIDNVFANNERIINIFKLENGSTMAVILVGAMLVGSMAISWHQSEDNPKGIVTPPHGVREPMLWSYGNCQQTEDSIRLAKGQELGFFQMGSTVITLFSKDAHPNQSLDQSLREQHVSFGQSLTC